MASSSKVVHSSTPPAKAPRIDPEAAQFRMRLAKSPIHRWGVYAAEPIPARSRIIEYNGERISRRETRRRSEVSRYTYLFTLDSYWTIDGAVGGSGAEYINHSCSPNIEARILRNRIFYFSLRDIKRGEELTLDYRFDKNVARVVCRCGSENCRGTINIKD